MINQKGLSVTELLITLLIAGVVLLTATGDLTASVAANRQTAAVNTFVTSVLLARSQAITKNQYTLICPSTDGQTCSDSRQWQYGWLVFGGPNAAAVLTTEGRQNILQHQAAIRHMQIQANRDYFLFRPFGKRASNGTLQFCTGHGSQPGKAVIISYTGRPRVSGFMSDGGPVTCQHNL